jgi:hypothetical protein
MKFSFYLQSILSSSFDFGYLGSIYHLNFAVLDSLMINYFEERENRRSSRSSIHVDVGNGQAYTCDKNYVDHTQSRSFPRLTNA